MGDNFDDLPGPCQGVAPIRLFFYVSKHTYTTTEIELETAGRFLKREGLMIVNDALLNSAALDLLNQISR